MDAVLPILPLRDQLEPQSRATRRAFHENGRVVIWPCVSRILEPLQLRVVVRRNRIVVEDLGPEPCQ